jgi:hypothetical protein
MATLPTTMTLMMKISSEKATKSHETIPRTTTLTFNASGQQLVTILQQQ